MTRLDDSSTPVVIVGVTLAAIALALCALEAPVATGIGHVTGLLVGWLLARTYGPALDRWRTRRGGR